MSDSNNTVQQVASGNSPQPATEGTPTSLDPNAIADEIVGEDADLELSDDDGSSEGADLAAKEEQLKASEAAMKALKKKLKLKVDGEELEEELSWDDEEGLKRHLQKSKAFDKRSSEFAMREKQVNQFFEALQKDPEAILEKMGLDVDTLAEKRLQKKIEQMQKSPEQLEREQMQKELEDLKAEKKRIEEEKQLAEMEKMKNQQAQEIESGIVSALENSKTKLPKKDPRVWKRVGEAMFFAMKHGYENVSPQDVIPMVEKQWKADLIEFFSVLPEDSIEEFVGKPNLDRVRKKRLAARKQAAMTASKEIVDTGTKKQTEDTDEKKPTKKMKDLFGYRD